MDESERETIVGYIRVRVFSNVSSLTPTPPPPTTPNRLTTTDRFTKTSVKTTTTRSNQTTPANAALLLLRDIIYTRKDTGGKRKSVCDVQNTR